MIQGNLGEQLCFCLIETNLEQLDLIETFITRKVPDILQFYKFTV